MYKLNIEGEARSGFMNLTILDNKHPNKIVVDWRNLKSFSTGEKIDLIVSYDIMRYVNARDLERVLSNWKNLLSDKGIIRLSFIECNRFIFSVAKREMDLQTIHNLLIGNNLYSLNDIIQSIKNIGFTINTISFDGLWASIEMVN